MQYDIPDDILQNGLELIELMDERPCPRLIELSEKFEKLGAAQFHLACVKYKESKSE